MQTPTLGVMTFYLNKDKRLDDVKFLIQLQRAAKKMNLDLIVFTPEDVDDSNRKIYSHLYDFSQKKWKRQWRKFPKMIFDRCRYQPNRRFQLLRKFRANYPELIYLNRPLGNKWGVYELFNRKESIRNHLPETRMYTRISDVIQMLERNRSVFVKPVNGTGGRGILKIRKTGKFTYTVEGRSMNRTIMQPKSYSEENLIHLLNVWKTGKKLLVQQGLDLTLSNGRVHDYRMLIQKDGQGRWTVTGMAGRIGAKSSITSNLHGGGRAVSADKLLQYWIGSKYSVSDIKDEAAKLAFNIVNVLESHYGKLCELALDLAIDRKGRVWLLEINPKPAREVFKNIGKKEIYARSIRLPLEYAMWLWNKEK